MKRCAIYTRKSTEEGLDQAFNSLDAQREACEAYIASQRHEGWKLVKTRFDDGGLSGGNMDRPALKALLAEIDAGRIDLIVVYKVDRLTRSLADFAKLVERFDAQEVSFVSVTQQFNTSSSMGRLTLNVLLSFAQFEREVTAERIKDKIAASRRKGLWTGGNPPLGYDNIDKKLVVNEAEAKTVRRLFELYLETVCVRSVLKIARDEGLQSKQRSHGGGKPITRGPLYHILANPIYVGLVRCGSELHEGAHDAIVDKALWDNVQSKRRAASQRKGIKTRSSNPLSGKLFADGHRLTPSHASKGGKRYRYYVSHAFEKGTAAATARWRINAETLDATIVKVMAEGMASPDIMQSLLPKGASASDLQGARHAIDQMHAEQLGQSSQSILLRWVTRIKRVDLYETGMEIILYASALFGKDVQLPLLETCVIKSQTHIGKRGTGLRLVLGKTETHPVPNETIAGLLKTAFLWRDRWFNNPDTALKDIAKEANTDISDVSKQMRLAFLAPDIVRALLDGTTSDDWTPERLRRLADLPLTWSEQRRLFGLAQN
ncbi:recombinase family protein [Hyphococcus lacteus]|uniref:Recombinase family protein n=1 Tax=Hyphococcus lacteus TaxID=3143536 RepID=A0ABV3Z7W8_9PROT